MYVSDSILYPLGWHCLVQLPSPSIRLHTDSVPDRPGEYFFGADYESRIITLTLTSGYLTSTTKPLARRDLMAIFDPLLGEQDFTYEGITYRVRYTQMMEIQDHAHHLQATVPLKMTDPFGYSEENSLTGSGTATNAGNYETYPTIEIAGPVTNPSVTVNGINLAYTGTVDEGDTLVIDCEDQTVYIGTANVIENFAGDFSSFQVGANIVVGTAVFKWRDKYI